MWPHGTSTTLIVLSEQTLHNCRSLEHLPTRARARAHTHTRTHKHPRTSHYTCLLLLRAALGQLQRFKRVTRQTKKRHSQNVRAWLQVSYLRCALDARAAAPASRFPQGQQARPHLEHKRHTSHVTRDTLHVTRHTPASVASPSWPSPLPNKWSRSVVTASSCCFGVKNLGIDV